MNRRLINKSILLSPIGFFIDDNLQDDTIKIGNDKVKIPDKWELKTIKYNEKDAVLNKDGDFKTVLNMDVNGIPTCRTVLYRPNDSRFQEVYIVPFSLCLNKDSFMKALNRSASQVDSYDSGLVLYMEDMNLYGFIVSARFKFPAPYKLMSESYV